MLSVLYSEYELWGCPNCGCDSVISSGVSGGGLTSGTCRHCKLKFEVRSENPMGIVKYGCHPENPSDPKSKWVMESAIRIEHPRKRYFLHGIGNQLTNVQKKENIGTLVVLAIQMFLAL